MNKYFLFVLLIMIFSSCLRASEEARFNYGAELDALPYLTDGYYLSGWIGKDKLRVRGVVASVNLPEFVVKSGFKDNSLNAYALIVDYFPKPDFSGTWYGGGFEIWESKIKSESDNMAATYSNLVVTAGGGYVWNFHKYFYLNPWVAVHGIVGGDETVNVGTKVFEPTKVTGEISLKIGFKY